MGVGNLVSASSTFSKSSLYFWNFSVHVLLKPSLKDFEYNLAGMWNECKCTVVWTFFGIVLLWEWNENWRFLVLWPLLTFPNLLTYWVQHFNNIRILNSSDGISSPLLALLVVMLPKAHLTLYSRVSGSMWLITPSWLFRSLRPFLYSSSVYSCYLLISSASVRSIWFLSFIVPNFAWNVPSISLILWRDL